MNAVLQTIFQGVVDGDSNQVKFNLQQALDAGLDPSTILQEGLIAPMREVGKLYEQGELFVPEMLVSARAMQEGLAILKPHLLQENYQSAGKIAIGTVKGDLHDIGKNLVAMMLEGAGYEVIDLGVDVSPEKFLAVLEAQRPDILAISALLSTTLPAMKTTIEAVRSSGHRVKVIVGGAPVTEEYAMKIGADGFAPDASRAVSLVSAILSE